MMNRSSAHICPPRKQRFICEAPSKESILSSNGAVSNPCRGAAGCSSPVRLWTSTSAGNFVGKHTLDDHGAWAYKLPTDFVAIEMSYVATQLRRTSIGRAYPLRVD